MNTDSILALIGTVAIIILLTVWSKISSVENDFTDETKKIDPYPEKQEWDRHGKIKRNLVSW